MSSKPFERTAIDPQLLQEPSDLPADRVEAGRIETGAARPVGGLGRTVVEYDRLFWGGSELRAAAAVLGTQAMRYAKVCGELSAHGRSTTDHGRGMLTEMECAAVELAKDAASYALRALELEGQSELPKVGD